MNTIISTTFESYIVLDFKITIIIIFIISLVIVI